MKTSKYKLIRTLVDCVEQFESERPKEDHLNLMHFTAWLVQQQKTKKAAPTPHAEPENPGTQINALLSYLQRYMQLYTKKVLTNSELVNADDFAYLATLYPNEKLSKTELIRRNRMEKTSGVEVIKRLLRKDLLIQENDLYDGRIKRVQLSPKGLELLQYLFPQMHSVAQLLTVNLQDTERMQLLHLLRKIDQFHHPIFIQNKANNLEELERLIAMK